MESDRTSPMLRVIQSQSIMNKHNRDNRGSDVGAAGGLYASPARLLKLDGLSNDINLSWHDRSFEDHCGDSIAAEDGITPASVG